MPDTTVDPAATDVKDAAGEKPSETNHVVPDESKQITLTPQQLKERLERARPADYDDLKAKASRLDEIEEASKSDLQRVTDARDALVKERDAAKSDALRFRIASKHGITDDDASLFLTGTDEDTLTRQAERLAGRDADRKRRGNYAPNEGRSSATGSDVDEERDTARQLFGADNT